MTPRRTLVSIALVAALAAASGASGEGTLSGGGSAGPKQSQRTELRGETRASDAPSPAAIAPGAAPEIGGHDEEWWRSKAAKLREKVESAESNLARCEERDARNRMASGLTPMDACAWQLSRVEKAEDNLSDFEDRARAKEVPPGWLR